MSKYNSIPSQIYGLPHYLIAGQFERTDELNHRIRERQFSDKPYEPHFGIQSISTRQTTFPIGMKNLNLQQITQPTTKRQNNCLNIETENELRCITRPLQKGIRLDDYVPTSQSELYRVILPLSSQQGTIPHPFLNKSGERMATTVPTTVQNHLLDPKRFNNFTKWEMRNVANIDTRR
ncbi:MAG: hypothetical protein EBS86_13905 [Crocinitomicaceae bacterium]|nr:hypothetical protein [Crocinitomicaceae bacterium]